MHFGVRTRIRGDLLKAEIDIDQISEAKYMTRRRRLPDQ